MPFSGKRMKLQTIMLSEISQTDKNKYHMFSLICGIHSLKMSDGAGHGWLMPEILATQEAEMRRIMV
jgi:hypothetical protein